MPRHRDYLQNVIESFAEVVKQALNLRRDGRYAEALALLNRAGTDVLKIDTLLLNTLSYSYLMDILNADTPTGAERCLLAADLLSTEAEVYADQDLMDEAAARWLKALQFYVDVLLFHRENIVPDQIEEINALEERLRGYTLPWRTTYNLFQLYQKAGRYAKAEDRLFDLIDAPESLDMPDAEAPDQGQLIAEGIGFYQSLLRKSDAELEAGDLPRAEVESGLQELLSE